MRTRSSQIILTENHLSCWTRSWTKMGLPARRRPSLQPWFSAFQYPPNLSKHSFFLKLNNTEDMENTQPKNVQQSFFEWAIFAKLPFFLARNICQHLINIFTQQANLWLKLHFHTVVSKVSIISTPWQNHAEKVTRQTAHLTAQPNPTGSQQSAAEACTVFIMW